MPKDDHEERFLESRRHIKLQKVESDPEFQEFMKQLKGKFEEVRTRLDRPMTAEERLDWELYQRRDLEALYIKSRDGAIRRGLLDLKKAAWVEGVLSWPVPPGLNMYDAALVVNLIKGEMIPAWTEDRLVNRITSLCPRPSRFDPT